MKKHLMVSVALSAIFAAVPALAQSSTAGQTDGPLEEVEVIGLKASLRDALETKREATGVVEVVSAKDIGVLPDVTIAETLNQIPGVNATRDRGNDSQVSISGLGPRMVLGLMNGREMASSEPDRNIRWEIFPSEIVSGVEVYKSSQADLVTGGISGTVNIDTIRPLDYKGASVTLRGGPVYYDGGSAYPDQNDYGYRFSGAYVDKINENIGFVVAATLQDQKNGYEDIQPGGWNPVYGGTAGPVVPGGPPVTTTYGPSFEGKAIDTLRGAVSSSLQWRPSSAFEARLDVLYSIENIDEHDQGAWISGTGNWEGSKTGDFTNNVIKNDTLVATTMTPAANSTIQSEIARYREDKTLFATGLNAKWNIADWQIIGDVAYSQAERAGLWQSLVFQNNAGALSYNLQPTVPTVTAQTSAAQAAANGTLHYDFWNGALSHLRDSLKSENIDASHGFESGMLTAIKIGLRATEREKDDAGAGGAASGNAQATNGVPSPTAINYASGAVPSSWFTPFNYKTLVAPTMISGDYNALSNDIFGPAGAAQANPDMWQTPFSSHVKETVEDAYAMLEYQLANGAVTGNFGLNVIHVSTNSEAPSNGPGSPTYSVGNDYTKALPSFNAKWDMGGGNFLKGGIAQELSRPALNDLRADRQITLNNSTGFYSGGGGDPKLKPYTADAIDISYENYFRKDGLFAVHPYYKMISNYIGYDTQLINLTGINGPVTFTSPYNAKKNGNLEGIEFIFQTPFFFIPHMENFGLYSNVSMARSNIHESSPVGNPFPMNGVAKETATFDLYYEDEKFESRLGLKYHSTFTLLYGWNAGSSGLSAIDPETTLDYSASYRVSKEATIRFQAGNLLNTPLKTYADNNPQELNRVDFYGRRFLIDGTYKF